MELVDTHCHLDAAPLCDDLERVLARAGEAGVTRVIVPGYDTEAGALAGRPGIWVALGLHPWVATEPLELDLAEITKRYRSVRDRVVPMIADVSRYVYEARAGGKSVLFEGAQGTFLDIDHGTYPYVTSSNTIAGAVCTGIGIGPSCIDHVVGIVKAYTTRVGNGPFPAELTGETGETIRKVGGEFGATTGRPRRCGWFDSVMVRRAVELNGMTRMVLTKLDVLNGFDQIKVCTRYVVDGRETDVYPSDPAALARAKPVYETVPGWSEDISAVRKFEDLPENTINYIKKIEKLVDTPIDIVSVGPGRNETIVLRNPFV